MDPRPLYEEALEARDAVLERLRAYEDRISNGRLLLFVFGVASLGLAILGGWPSWPPFLALAGFVGLIAWHIRLLEKVDLATRSRDYFRAGLERLSNRWVGQGVEGTLWLPPKSLFAFDLDVFGRGSLFERLCTCRTQFGRESLAKWLTETPSVETVHARQGAVQTLVPRWEFREQLHLLGQDVASEVDPALLREWSQGEPLPSLRPVLALLLTSTMILATLGWALDWWGVTPFLLVLGVQLFFRRLLGDIPGQITGAVQEASRELNTVGTVLGIFEKTSLGDPWLEKLRGQLVEDGASQAIARLDRTITWLDARLNQLFAPIAILLLWEVHFAHWIERWRVAHGESVREWLHILGELEATSALAGYSFESPDSVFPEVVDGPAAFEGKEVGHPLLPADHCVPNDVSLGGDAKVWLVSGSNMSGKSTLLRSVGVNTILAFAGGPVRAKSVRVAVAQIGASLKSRDSLMEGTSRFYEEIRHLGDFVQAANAGPFLFLIDEIFNGTNSHDRALGAGALTKEFVRLGAIGMLTTHDLALTEIGESLERVRNVHLEDRLVDGKLQFDYLVRPGVVERSNALELMRLVGLPV